MSGMRVLVLGATGGTGQQVVAKALEHGCIVTAFCRDPARLPIVSDSLRVVAGSVVANDSTLADAVRDQDAVISALGVGKSFKSAQLIGQAMPRIVHAMETHGVRRLVFTSAFGVGDTWRDVPLLPRLFIRLLLKEIYADKEAGELALRRSSLDWTLVYPSSLVNGAFSGRCRMGERLALRGFPTISRADVAEFLVRQTDDATYVRKGVMISS